MIKVEMYTEKNKDEWNGFLSTAKNQTFLFRRGFMDYHSDRFIDHSLLIYDNGILSAVLPANLRKGSSIVSSHDGLTYGGFIVNSFISSQKALEYLYYAIKFLYDQNITDLVFKQIPNFYNLIPSDEIDYGLFVLEAEVIRMEIASVVKMDNKIPIARRRRQGVQKAIKSGVKIHEVQDFIEFWDNILSPNLLNRFNTKPVHSLEEISSLKENNPKNIRQFNSFLDNKVIAGCTIFQTETTAHCQYISAQEDGRQKGALDLLFQTLITEYFSDKLFFDFGTVNENEGRSINKGLLDWKESFGARSFVHRVYKLQTINYNKLEFIIN